MNQSLGISKISMAQSIPLEESCQLNKKKIKIETSADLYKLPYSVLKNAKIYDFEGKYFDQIYEEALKIERSGGLDNFSMNAVSKKEINFKKIIFEMTYQTVPGEELGIIGSFDKLGNWNQDKALRLQWSDGHVWKITIDYNYSTDFEYKFIFVKNGKVVKWEDGNNRIFSFDNIKRSIEGNIKGEKCFIENINEVSYLYNSADSSLKIIAKWNKK